MQQLWKLVGSLDHDTVKPIKDKTENLKKKDLPYNVYKATHIQIQSHVHGGRITMIKNCVEIGYEEIHKIMDILVISVSVVFE